MDSIITYGIFLALVLIVAVPYWIRTHKRNKLSREALAKTRRAGIGMPATLHPHIDISLCIGCGSCVRVCPEDVLGMVNGHVAVVNGMKCVSHGLCRDVCPVGAIRLDFGPPKEGQELPLYDEHFQTNVPGLYVAGELGGIGLVRNAVTQALTASEHLASTSSGTNGVDVDVIVAGAGPAGMAASLALKARNIRYLTLEQDEIGGSLLHYPRGKLVLTSPVELPLFGKMKVGEIKKEDLLALWRRIAGTYALNIKTRTKLDAVRKEGDVFFVRAGAEEWRAKNVILALGRRGSPRKLGVAGESLAKVAYRLIEAERITDSRVLVVGGGDSAVEAAVALARQRGNGVTLSYRRNTFVRLKEKNEKNIGEMMKTGKVITLFNSNVQRIDEGNVQIETEGKGITTIPNDLVFVFAGGELPAELLRNAGIAFRTA